MRDTRGDKSTGHLWIEPGEQTHSLVAEVAPVWRVNRTYSYVIPAGLESALSIGLRVRVPIGRRGQIVEGFVVHLERRPWDTTLRPIASTVDAETFLTPELVQLARQISEHYRCPLGRTLKGITPESVRRQSGLVSVQYARLAQSIEEIMRGTTRISSRRKAALSLLAQSPDPVSSRKLRERSGVSRGIILAMARDGWIILENRKEQGDPMASPPEPTPQANVANSPAGEPDFVLSDDQRNALEQIQDALRAACFSVTLLYGVSASGKTEVYIHAIRHALSMGHQTILLVPEIILTTQLVERLASRLPGIAVQHSRMTGVQRAAMWRSIAAGRVSVVVGTRAAVFAPCPRLGLIVVDEEQETSFKNLRAPRYHVRDVAVARATNLNIPVLLGSATPSLEAWHDSQTRPGYRRVTLAHRVQNRPMPKIHLVDMRIERVEAGLDVVFSRTMSRLLAQAMECGQQAFMLINRRGYARLLYCPHCRLALSCPNCATGYIIHAGGERAMCHYCRSQLPTPKSCSTVGCGESLILVGAGTQRIERLLADRFPKARVRRVDSDLLRKQADYQRLVRGVADQEIDIVIGTQMIAKGLDFPGVAFVGILDADAEWLGVDFRAHERLFQLMTQMAGRAGRADQPGTVVVQTIRPELPAFQYSVQHDYPSFAARELNGRASAGWPPVRRLARLVLAHSREELVRKESLLIADRLQTAMAQLKLIDSLVLPPEPCAIRRLRRRYRHHVLLRASSSSDLRKLLSYAEEHGLLRVQQVSVVVDVDPVSFS